PLNGRGLQIVRDLAGIVPDQAALRENVRAALETLDRAAHDRLGVSEAVSGRGIDPVDAKIQPGADRGNRLLVVLRTPAEFPFASADRPRSDPDPRDVQIALSQLSCFHK